MPKRKRSRSASGRKYPYIEIDHATTQSVAPGAQHRFDELLLACAALPDVLVRLVFSYELTFRVLVRTRPSENPGQCHLLSIDPVEGHSCIVSKNVPSNRDMVMSATSRAVCFAYGGRDRDSALQTHLATRPPTTGDVRASTNEQPNKQDKRDIVIGDAHAGGHAQIGRAQDLLHLAAPLSTTLFLSPDGQEVWAFKVGGDLVKTRHVEICTQEQGQAVTKRVRRWCAVEVVAYARDWSFAKRCKASAHSALHRLGNGLVNRSIGIYELRPPLRFTSGGADVANVHHVISLLSERGRILFHFLVNVSTKTVFWFQCEDASNREGRGWLDREFRVLYPAFIYGYTALYPVLDKGLNLIRFWQLVYRNRNASSNFPPTELEIGKRWQCDDLHLLAMHHAPPVDGRELHFLVLLASLKTPDGETSAPPSAAEAALFTFSLFQPLKSASGAPQAVEWMVRNQNKGPQSPKWHPCGRASGTLISHWHTRIPANSCSFDPSFIWRRTPTNAPDTFYRCRTTVLR